MTNTTYPPAGFKPDRPLAERQAAWSTRQAILAHHTNTTKEG